MKVNVKPVVFAGLLAVSVLAAHGQSATAPAPSTEPHASHGMHAHAGDRHGDRHAAWESRKAQRAAELKAKLQLNAEQENSWNAFVAAMKPPAHGARPQREEMAKLSTPERLDKMKEMRQQREAAFAQREAATRTFYASLNAEQKKVFDESTARMHRHGHHRGHG